MLKILYKYLRNTIVINLSREEVLDQNKPYSTFSLRFVPKNHPVANYNSPRSWMIVTVGNRIEPNRNGTKMARDGRKRFAT